MSAEDLHNFFEKLELEPGDHDGVEGFSFEEFIPIVAPVKDRLSKLVL